MHIACIPRKEDLLTKETKITEKFDKWYYLAEEFFNVDEAGSYHNLVWSNQFGQHLEAVDVMNNNGKLHY